MMITSDVDESLLVPRVERALAAGVDYVQLRRVNRPGREVETLAKRIAGLAPTARGRLLVNGRLDVALSSRAKGVHLPSRGLPVGEVRKVAPPGFVVSRSTHQRAEVERAFDEGASFVVFGPIFPTASKPGHPGVGLKALENAVSSAPIPVYALGGIAPDRIAQIAETGAHGIAGISIFEEEDSLRALFERLDSMWPR
jgi:thiamine-phosphate pyrophosphorylase